MKSRSYSNELQDAIQLLEAEQAGRLQSLKEQFRQVSENIQPANLVQNALREISDSPHIVSNLLSAGVGLAAGYVSKKIIRGGSRNILVRSLGTILQFGVTILIAQNPKAFKSIDQFITKRFSHKEE